MDKTITLLMGIHCHQPVGNFNWVFEEAYGKSYKPFLDVLERHPGVKVALHYSGSLLDWIVKNRPEFIKRLNLLVKKSQIEMMTGGYYEPILTMIPERDIYGQVSLLTDFIKNKTSYKTKGLWLAERVWESELIEILDKAGIIYTIVDDYHFQLAGFDIEKLSGYYRAERGGYGINLFPSSKKLRYIMPFSKAYEVIDYLRTKASSEKETVLTFGDDGEKFGLWPHTYDWVYKEKWLENFLSLLEQNSSWIRVMTFSEYIKDCKATSCVELPAASYAEMMEWSGGNFNNFFLKYPEASDMRDKMFYISDKLDSLSSRKNEKSKGNGLGLLKKAKLELYKGQCNCPYWHGIFGGLYLGYLRSSIYSHLIDVEKLIDEIEHKDKDWVSIEEIDINKDAKTEVVLSNSKLEVLVNPEKGGILYELDYKVKSINLLNTLSRKEEGYHAKIKTAKVATLASCESAPKTIHNDIGLKDNHLEDLLFYDKYKKSALIDHFLQNFENINNFAEASLKELGDFIEKPYSFKAESQKNSKKLILSRETDIDTTYGKSTLEVVKSILISSNSSIIEVEYKIKNRGKNKVSARFGVESNLFLKDENFAKINELKLKKELDIKDEWSGVELKYKFDKNADIWAFELETVSGSESGLERTFQELSLMFIWDIYLEPSTEFDVKILQSIK